MRSLWDALRPDERRAALSPEQADSGLPERDLGGQALALRVHKAGPTGDAGAKAARLLRLLHARRRMRSAEESGRTGRPVVAAIVRGGLRRGQLEATGSQGGRTVGLAICEGFVRLQGSSCPAGPMAPSRRGPLTPVGPWCGGRQGGRQEQIALRARLIAMVCVSLDTSPVPWYDLPRSLASWDAPVWSARLGYVFWYWLLLRCGFFFLVVLRCGVPSGDRPPTPALVGLADQAANETKEGTVSYML